MRSAQLDKRLIVLQKKLRRLLRQNVHQVTPTVNIGTLRKHIGLNGARGVDQPEAGPTAAHIVAQGVEVIAGPGPDPLIEIIAGHPPTADQTLTTPRKQVPTRKTY